MAETFGRMEKPMYYSGQMQKKGKGENEFQMYNGELCGSTIFFYKDDKQDTLELRKLKSMEPVSSSRSTDSIYTLKFSKQEVQLKFDNPDTGELWRGYILTVAKLEVPSNLQLLPRQIMMLREIRTAEEKRRASESSRPTTMMSTTPSCFLKVSREKAEKLLEENPEYGSLILRPATDKPHFSITTRQIFPSGPHISHYKITSNGSSYTIELDKPVTVQTLDEVVDHFMEKTAKQLQPFTKSQPQCTLA